LAEGRKSANQTWGPQWKNGIQGERGAAKKGFGGVLNEKKPGTAYVKKETR